MGLQCNLIFIYGDSQRADSPCSTEYERIRYNKGKPPVPALLIRAVNNTAWLSVGANCYYSVTN